ncbi:head decoration protein [Photorhabdus luminescens]|uniref:Head decoration protein n=1 Tax=Photorhabdus luminescens subsp. mexicana TaxID=2100167 RepID=A0A4R4IS37_PHOLU|nr:head decoration protein [Photorhabdus luminescens]TDB43332.1 head decoration protein [Photorhabdus luminescens subsp. mexicana]
MEQIGQNPFAPGMTSTMFVPDQLVSGPLQLVTDTVTIAKVGKLKRGTVLGVITEINEYVLSVKTAKDGREKPIAILVDDVDTTTESKSCGVYLMGEFNEHKLIFDASWTLEDLKIALRPSAIFIRDAIQAPIA